MYDIRSLKKAGKKILYSERFSPAIRVFILMLVVTGIVYPLVLVAIGQSILPFQSNGSLTTPLGQSGEGRKVGSILISQDFNSSKFFHSRPTGDSASGVDPHISPEFAMAQISNVTKETGIPPNALRTIVELNIERNKVGNLLAFAPNHVNVLEVNLELVKQYPEIYSEFLTQNEKQMLLRGEQS